MKYTKEFCYFLGFVWADGYLWKNNSTGNYRIILENSKEDLQPILQKIKCIGNFSLLERTRLNSKIPILRATLYSKKIFILLSENGYLEKSLPHQIIKKIPTNLHRYFWRGLFDGDGCFGVYPRSKRNSTDYRTEMVSCVNQDWSALESLCLQKDIQYKIEKITNTTGSYSRFSIRKIANMIKFGLYIYQGYTRDSLGLKRKFKKFQQILNHGRTNT